MSEKIKIPIGWELIPTGEKSKPGDRFLNSATRRWNKEYQETLIRDGLVPHIRRQVNIRPAPAKAKRAGKPVKARCSYAIPGSNTMHSSKATARYYAGFSANEVARFFVLPANADSVARMVKQVATVLAGTSGTNMSDEDVAKDALAAIGITGRRKAQQA